MAVHHPKVIVPRSFHERFRRALVAVLLVTLWVEVARVWPLLPARVPSHFGASGAPDAWASRGSLLFLPLLATVFFVGLSWLERVPHVYGYPVEVTTENAPRLYAAARRLVLDVKLVLVLAFGFVFRASVDVALGKATGLPVWFLPALLATTAALLIFGVVNMKRASAS